MSGGPASSGLRGRIKVVLDSAALTASLVYTVDYGGEAWDAERVAALLRGSGLSWGSEGDGQIAEALRLLSSLESGTRTVVALRAEAPGSPLPDVLEWQSHPVPPELAAESERALAAAAPPVVFDIQVTKQKVEEVRRRKALLPFLRPKVDTVVRTVRNERRVPVGVDPKPEDTGFVRRNDALALIRPGRAGSPGRDLRGKPIPGAKPDKVKVLVGAGVSLRGTEVRAETDGFYRRGRNWVDIVPYQENRLRVYAGPDRRTCLLDFRPGTGQPPAADAVIAAARDAGFAEAGLIPRAAIEALLAQSTAEARPLARQVISASHDGWFAIEVSEDRMRATLTMCKATGQGKPLALAEVGRAINERGFKGLDTSRVRADILAFHRGPSRELLEYVLVEGAAPVAGPGGAPQWQVELLEAQRVKEIESRLGPDTRDGFPPVVVERAAFVRKGQPVAAAAPPSAGRSGRDVFGAEVPAPVPPAVELRIGAGLRRENGAVVAVEDGVLEIVEALGAAFARVRRYDEGAIVVRVADSRMEAFLSLDPASGRALDAATVKAAVRARGVVRGVDDALIEGLAARASRGEVIRDALIARGRPAVDQVSRRLVFSAALAAGAAGAGAAGAAPQGAPRPAPRAAVRSGQEIARTESPSSDVMDGFDVLGAALPARRDPAMDVRVGANVECVVESDGRIRFVARRSGELRFDGTLLDVEDLRVVDEAAPGTLLRFAGSVQVRGGVGDGAGLFAGDDVDVGRSVGRALVSSDGSIAVEGGVSGGAVLRARKDITAARAQGATLLAVGDVRIDGGCAQCQVRTNGRAVMDGATGTLVGGRLKARKGLRVRVLGSPKGVRTEVSFGQDYLVEDQIAAEEREIAKLKAGVASLDARISSLAAAGSRAGLEDLGREKARRLEILQRRSLRLLSLREMFEAHSPSQVVIPGTLHPGVVFESHGRVLEIASQRAQVVVSFDQEAGRIEVRPL